MFKLFKKDNPQPKPEPITPEMLEDEMLYGGMMDTMAFRVLSIFGFSRENVETIKTLVDAVEVKEVGGKTEITVKLNKITVKIDK